MPEKVCVKKQGSLMTVFLDGNWQPLPLATFEDRPICEMTQTYNNISELQRDFPTREFTFFEAPKKPENVVIKTPEVIAEAERVMAKRGMKLPTTPTPQKTPTIVQTEVVGLVLPQNDVQLTRAREFLKRLEYAERYASKENEVTLAIQIQVVEELLREVFGAI